MAKLHSIQLGSSPLSARLWLLEAFHPPAFLETAHLPKEGFAAVCGCSPGEQRIFLSSVCSEADTQIYTFFSQVLSARNACDLWFFLFNYNFDCQVPESTEDCVYHNGKY